MNQCVISDEDPELLIARRQREQYGISSYEYRCWKAQKDSAKRRGIPFRFSFLAWHFWWNDELARRPGSKRGRRKGEFMMCRKADSGAYEEGNVYCGTPQDNADDIPLSVRMTAREKALITYKKTGSVPGSHLKVRGDGHPRSKAVMTDLGRFGSIALAAEAHGITRAGGHHRVRTGAWRLVD